MVGVRWLVVVGLVALGVGGCSEGEEASTSTAAETATRAVEPPAPEPTSLRAPRCPPYLGNCSRASGTVLYVERVDPDGDGDAHFVLASGDSITAPGISVVDVRPDLRPTPLPGPGDSLAAAGPVYEGSFGQRQIEAVEIAVTGDR